MVKRKHALAKCEDCPLAKTGKAVHSDGPQDASIAIVGEAPGRDEHRKGKPFVGISGQLLNAVLSHNGIERNDVLVTNVVLCRPPGNQVPPT
jgi:uracil-DNA glycosylase